jgi:NAD(P)-dependent dehydrogenase (short-subunit alcohol dehydrogenase family)
LATEFGVGVLGEGVDVSSPAEVDGFASSVVARFGAVDAVINNAAVIGPVGPITATDPVAWAAALSANVVGPANMFASFGPALARRPAGRVINLSGGGVGGPTAMRRTSAYVVSKFAVVALTEAAAIDFEGTSVTVNAVAPGAIPTSFLDDVAIAGPERAGEDLHADAVRRMDESVEPHHVQAYLDLIDFLLSPDSGWLTGRMLSARWESPARLAELGPRLSDPLFRLRRIDNALFTEVTR